MAKIFCEVLSGDLPVKVAGSLFVMAGAIYLGLSLILVVSGGSLPANGQEVLEKLSTQGPLLELAMLLFIVKDLSVLVAFPILALAVGKSTRTLPFMATAFASVAMILDIISGLLVISLRPFAAAYLKAPDTLRPIYILDAGLLHRYIWRVETPFMVVLLSLAVVLFSVCMRKTHSMKPASYAGVVVGAIGIAGGVLGFIQPVLLLALWYVAVGMSLLRLKDTQCS